MEPLGDVLKRVKVPEAADARFVPLFVPRGARSYWCRLCDAVIPSRLGSRRALAQHGSEHQDAGEAALDREQWVTTRKLVDEYEVSRKRRARGVL